MILQAELVQQLKSTCNKLTLHHLNKLTDEKFPISHERLKLISSRMLTRFSHDQRFKFFNGPTLWTQHITSGTHTFLIFEYEVRAVSQNSIIDGRRNFISKLVKLFPLEDPLNGENGQDGN